MRMEQRWRYEKRDGTPVWLAFDPDFSCVYCDQAVGQLSMGGPAVCGKCDCGYSKTTNEPWTIDEAMLAYQHANERIDALPNDPMWAEYETTYESARKKKTAQ
jgi:hypothetical protein